MARADSVGVIASKEYESIGMLVMREAQQYRKLGRLDAELSDEHDILSCVAEAIQGLISTSPRQMDERALASLLDSLDTVKLRTLIEQRQILDQQLCETRRKLIRFGVRVAA